MKKLKRIKQYTTTWKYRKGHPLPIEESNLIHKLWGERVDILINALSLYDKYDKIIIDLSSDERRK